MAALKQGISLIINTKDEASNIRECIASARGLVDEVVVVDMNSKDDTVDIARKLGARTFEVEDYGYVEPVRNFAISKAIYKWVLLLDADERIGKSLSGKILKIVAENKYDVVRIPRKNILLGKWIRHSGWWPDMVAKLFKKSFVFWPKKIHAEPKCSGRVLTLTPTESNSILHKNCTTVAEFVDKINKYTSFEKGFHINKEFEAVDMLDYYENEFDNRYFNEKGYLDGLHGFFLSKLMEFYRFLEMAKYWERKGYKDVFKFGDSRKFVEKHLENAGRIRELEIIKGSKFYKLWQVYFRARDRILK